MAEPHTTMPYEDLDLSFEPEGSRLGDRMGRFAFVPRLPRDDGQGQTTTVETRILLCPSALPDERVRKDRCTPIDHLAVGETVYDALTFPGGRAVVLVLEQHARFYGPRGQLRGRPIVVGPRFPGLFHFTPGGRLLAHWSAGSGVDAHALFDERGRRLPCAAGGELAPDGRRMLAVDYRWMGGYDGADMWWVDLDTCREGPILELTPEQCGKPFTQTFDATGATVTFADGQTARLDMRHAGPVHRPRTPARLSDH